MTSERKKAQNRNGYTRRYAQGQRLVSILVQEDVKHQLQRKRQQHGSWDQLMRFFLRSTSLEHDETTQFLDMSIFLSPFSPAYQPLVRARASGASYVETIERALEFWDKHKDDPLLTKGEF